MIVLSALPLRLSFSFTHTPVSVRSLYIVYFRIGSLSTRDPPPSPLSYGPIVVFSPSLLPSLLAAPLLLKAPQHHPNSPFPQNRESVWQFTRAIFGTEGSSALSSHAASLSSPPFRSPSVLCPTSPSIGPVRILPVPRRTPTTLSSRSYTL